MLDTYFTYGGVEIANGERVRGYMRTGDCRSSVLVGDPCPTLRDALGHEEYTAENIDQAPWYSPTVAASQRFYGVEVIEVKGAAEPRRSIASIENIGDGLTFTAMRKDGREVRFRVSLFAADMEAMEYGRAWLATVLDGSTCAGGCGPLPLAWLADCPEGAASLPRLRRELLDAVTTSGPSEGDLTKLSGGGFMQEMEFTLTSELPAVYSAEQTLDVDQPEPGPSPVLEVFRNMVGNGRIRNESALVEVGRNLVLNPSFEGTSISQWHGLGFGGVGSPTISRLAKPSWLPGSGTNALRAFYPANADFKFTSVGAQTSAIAVSPGETLRIRAAVGGYAYAANGTTIRRGNLILRAGFYAAPELTAQQLSAVSVTIDTGQRVLNGVGDLLATAPAGAAYVRLIAAWADAAGSVPNGAMFCWIDDAAIIRDTPNAGYLTVPGALTVLPEIFPMGGRGSVSDLQFAWAGTANNSQTIIRAAPVATAYSDDPGVKMYRVRGQDVAMIHAFPTGPDENHYVGVTAVGVTPGAKYYPVGQFARTSAQDSAGGWIELWVRFRGSAGQNLGDHFTSIVRPVPHDWVDFAGAGIEAPAGAVDAIVGLNIVTGGIARHVQVRRLGLLESTPDSGWFDGATADGGGYEYTWDGTAFASPSTATPVPSTVIVDPLADPDCPPIPMPPAPPVIVDPCATEVTSWSRFFYPIQAGGLAQTLRTIPALTIESPVAVDALRVWLLPVEAAEGGGIDYEAIPLTSAVASWEITYLPAATPLRLDSLYEQVTAVVDGEDRAADHLVLGQGNEPVMFPELYCDGAYVLVIDVPYEPLSPYPAPSITGVGRTEFA